MINTLFGMKFNRVWLQQIGTKNGRYVSNMAGGYC